MNIYIYIYIYKIAISKGSDLALLEEKEWKEFKIEEVFSVKRGKRHIENHRQLGLIQYVSASSINNGVTDFISNPLFIDKDKLVVSTFCDSYFIEGTFTASDEMTILGHNRLNKRNGLFISKIISSNKDKYAFGRKAFSNRLKSQIIILPITEDGNPDWQFMEDYIKIEEILIAQKLIAYYRDKIL